MKCKFLAVPVFLVVSCIRKTTAWTGDFVRMKKCVSFSKIYDQFFGGFDFSCTHTFAPPILPSRAFTIIIRKTKALPESLWITLSGLPVGFCLYNGIPPHRAAHVPLHHHFNSVTVRHSSCHVGNAVSLSLRNLSFNFII